MSRGESMILPRHGDRGIVVFWVWQSLDYGMRVLFAFSAIAAGLVIQLISGTILPGVIALAIGNLLLLTKGYDNRVDLGKFDAAATWERAGREKLAEIRTIEKNIRTWDLNILDATNAAGGVIFVSIAVTVGLAAWFLTGLARVLAVDALVLFLPHWITGVRRILTLPGLLIKVQCLDRALEDMKERIGEHRLDILVLLHESEEATLPGDVKFRIVPKDAPEEFLGLYGQVALNEVQGRSFPYFYVVLVAKRGFGLEKAHEEYRPPYYKIVPEHKIQDDVEVFVLRQHADKRGGWHVKTGMQGTLLEEGIALAERVTARK